MPWTTPVEPSTKDVGLGWGCAVGSSVIWFSILPIEELFSFPGAFCTRRKLWSFSYLLDVQPSEPLISRGQWPNIYILYALGWMLLPAWAIVFLGQPKDKLNLSWMSWLVMWNVALKSSQQVVQQYRWRWRHGTHAGSWLVIFVCMAIVTAQSMLCSHDSKNCEMLNAVPLTSRSSVNLQIWVVEYKNCNLRLESSHTCLWLMLPGLTSLKAAFSASLVPFWIFLSCTWRALYCSSDESFSLSAAFSNALLALMPVSAKFVTDPYKQTNLKYNISNAYLWDGAIVTLRIELAMPWAWTWDHSLIKI